MGRLKVLSYWNLNRDFRRVFGIKGKLKVLSYWNLNMRASDISEGEVKT